VNYITANKVQSNPEKPRGFFRVEQTSKVINLDGSLWKNTRSHLIKGYITDLEETLVENKYSTIAGKIIYTEIVESDLELHPALKKTVVSEWADTPISDFTPDQLQEYERRLQKYYIKKTSADGVVLLNNGDRILRFTQFDITSSLHDTTVEHTNVAEVTAFKIAERLEKANTPANLPS
jgi:hypothetical protein